MEMQVDVKWWAMRQNNSGGYYIVNDAVAHWVFVQARNAKEAESVALKAVENDLEYCECCGERWWPSFEFEEGTEEPTCYDQYYKDFRGWISNEEARLYFYDGAIGSYKWDASIKLELEK